MYFRFTFLHISGLYHISYENALQDTKEFILLLKQNGCMEEL